MGCGVVAPFSQRVTVVGSTSRRSATSSRVRRFLSRACFNNGARSMLLFLRDAVCLPVTGILVLPNKSVTYCTIFVEYYMHCGYAWDFLQERKTNKHPSRARTSAPTG